jgi:putative PIN family toxin of toxin-antitoxin system
MPTLVLDTNIVLDLFVFADARARSLNEHLERGGANWLATQAMRDELERVLAYAHIESRLDFYGLQACDVLTRFDRHARIVDAPSKAPVTCKDPDDQKFIDLAVAHRSMLLSKDAAVLAMTKRLALLEVIAAPVMPSLSCRTRSPSVMPDLIRHP